MVDHSLTFYDMMGYTVPVPPEPFLYGKESSETTYHHNTIATSFPGWEINPQQKSILQHYSFFLKNIPFIEAAFLHNDICFDPQETTHIEICIIVAQNRLWTSFLWYHSIIWILQIISNIQKNPTRITCSVRTDERNYNFIDRLINTQDIRTMYRVAHMVELYQSYPNKYKIFKENDRLRKYLPNISDEKNIELCIPVITGNSPFKKVVERFLSGIVGNIFEWCSQKLSLIILLLLKRFHYIAKDSNIQKNYISLLHDKRQSTSVLWKMFSKETPY